MVGFLLMLAAGNGARAAGPKRVLVLDPFGHQVAPFSEVISTFRTTLARELGESVSFQEVPLDLAQFGASEAEDALVGYLVDRIGHQPVDLVVPIGGGAAQFVARNRERLCPAIPILAIAAEPRLVPPGLLQGDATLVTQRIDLAGMVEDILQMRPETTHIAVVFGASALERTWVAECRRAFQAYDGRVTFSWLDGLPLEEVVRRCADLPAGSFILHGLFLVDGAGVPCENSEVLRRLHEKANAPVFAYFASEFGQGGVGGRLFQDSFLGEQGARVAVRILRGEDPATIPPQIFEAASPVYDWRELQRWGIREGLLPPASVVQFRETSFGTHYKWWFLGAVVFLLIQAALIAGLLIARRRWLQAEAQATLVAEISSRFVNLPSGEVDREIEDAQRRLCEGLGIDASVLWQPSGDTPGHFVVTHVFRHPSAPEFPRQLTEQDFPWTAGELLAGRISVASSLSDLPPQAAIDVASARRAGIQSHVTIPLVVGGARPIGILGFNVTRGERRWRPAVVARLVMIAQIFANALGRKRADEALRESEERMTMASEAARFGVWVWYLGRDEVWGSDAWMKLFGFVSTSPLRYDDVLERIHPDDRERVDREVRRTVAEHTGYAGEFRVVLPDGTQRWIASQGRAVTSDGASPRRVLGAAIDITERRRAEEQVRQLSLAVEQSPVAVVITDLQGRIIYVNNKFTEVSGYSLAECLGQTPRILKSGEHPAAVYEELWRCIRSGNIWRGEFHNRRKNGELYWEWEVISPLIDASGRVTHFVGIKEDITERKHAEDAIRLGEARLAAGAELVGLGYYEIDYTSQSCFADERWREIMGFSSDAFEGLKAVEFWFAHVHPDFQPAIMDLRRSLVGGAVDRVSAEYRYVHPVKGVRWIHQLTRIVSRSRNGGGPRTVGVVRDITQEKQAQLETLELHAKISHVGRVNVLGQLASALAHELSQPLGAILRNAEAAELMLREPSPDLEELRAIITDIRDDDRRAGLVIDRLRSLLKRGTLDPRPIELPEVIHEVLALVRTDAASRHVRLVCAIAAELPRVSGDRIHLQQVLLNLLVNAMDAIVGRGSDRGCIEVSARRIAHDMVEVKVTDDGPGLPADKIAHLFEAFFTTKAKGMGMGLAVSRTIIEAHKGRLWAENRAEGGASFIFTLPVADPGAPAAGDKPALAG